MNTSQTSTATPRTYWLESRSWGFLYIIWGILFFTDHLWGVITGSRKPEFSDFVFPTIYLLVATTFTFYASRSFVRLSLDAITVGRLFRKEVLPFDKIKGRRRYAEKADPYGTPPRHLVLEPKDDSFPRVDLKESRAFDEAFYCWFDSLPDLDKRDGIEEPTSKYANFSLV